LKLRFTLVDVDADIELPIWIVTGISDSCHSDWDFGQLGGPWRL
jgi:hypothetical protein